MRRKSYPHSLRYFNKGADHQIISFSVLIVAFPGACKATTAIFTLMVEEIQCDLASLYSAPILRPSSGSVSRGLTKREAI